MDAGSGEAGLPSDLDSAPTVGSESTYLRDLLSGQRGGMWLLVNAHFGEEAALKKLGSSRLGATRFTVSDKRTGPALGESRQRQKNP